MVEGHETNQIYRQVVLRIRKEQEKVFGPGRVKTYLPFCLTKLIENLSLQGQRDAIIDDLESHAPHHSISEPIHNIKNFMKLFLLNQDQADKIGLVSEPYQQTYFGKIQQEQVNYGSPVVKET
jgi:hypothetical protein